MQTKGIGRLAALLLAALLALVLLPGAALAAAPDGMTITPETTQEEIDEHFGAGYLQIGEVGGVCTLTVLQDINMDGVNPLNLGVRLGGRLPAHYGSRAQRQDDRAYDNGACELWQPHDSGQHRRRLHPHGNDERCVAVLHDQQQWLFDRRKRHV